MAKVKERTLGQWLRKAREDSGLSAERVARSLRPMKSPRTITNWETGSTEPDTTFFLQLCALYASDPRKAPYTGPVPGYLNPPARVSQAA